MLSERLLQRDRRIGQRGLDPAAFGHRQRGDAPLRRAPTLPRREAGAAHPEVSTPEDSMEPLPGGDGGEEGRMAPVFLQAYLYSSTPTAYRIDPMKRPKLKDGKSSAHAED